MTPHEGYPHDPLLGPSCAQDTSCLPLAAKQVSLPMSLSDSATEVALVK